jgi:hypothetical protein
VHKLSPVFPHINKPLSVYRDMRDKDFDAIARNVLDHFLNAKLFHGCLVGMGFKKSSNHPELNDLHYLTVTEQVEIEVSYVTGEGRLFVSADGDRFESIPIQLKNLEQLHQLIDALRLPQQG